MQFLYIVFNGFLLQDVLAGGWAVAGEQVVGEELRGLVFAVVLCDVVL